MSRYARRNVLGTRAAIVTAAMLSCGAHAGIVEITGVISDETTLLPIEGALVSLQATGPRTTTAADGSYALMIPTGTELVIVAAKKGYYNRSAVVNGPPPTVNIDLEPVPPDDDPTYALLSPSICAGCHPDQHAQWLGSPMSNAGINTWVHDIYDGNGTPGGMGGFVYTRDSVFAESNPNSECASCHQPEPWIGTPFSRMEGPDDPGYPSAGAAPRISCDVCHKVAHVDVENINYPGLFPGAADFTRPQGPGYPQVEYGRLGDVDFELPFVMRASYQPQLRAEVCGLCHQDKNDVHETQTFDGVISEPTYLEWLASPYADEQSPYYADCLDCHMPPSGADRVCQVLNPPLLRDPDTIRTHEILGSTPEYLENAAEVEIDAAAVGTDLEVTVHVVNSFTGHYLPTGVTVRNMILLVDAWRDEDGTPLVSVGDQVVHDLGGVGDPAQGYYAGLPGKFFAKVNHDAEGNGPTFFTDATGIQFDNRIPALQTDSSSYAFALPAEGGPYRVRARLIYRRAFRFLVDAKQWTEDGHGQPLVEVQPPYYGHLMEEEQFLVTCGPADLDGDAEVGFSDLLVLLGSWGACAGCPADLDGNGSVGFADLLVLLGTWGPC